MAITVKNLSYTYHPDTAFQRKALVDVNLTVEDGEFVGILGASGSGKSTFLQTLNGSIATKNSVFVDDFVIGDKKTRLLDVVSKVALAFQYPEQQIFCDTVAEEIGFGPKNLGRTDMAVKKAVEKYAAALGLTKEYFIRSPFDLSGGEKRRVALASIFAMETPILLLDEPTVALDSDGRKRVGNLVAALNRDENRTVLWVGHNLEEISGLARRLVIFHQGRIVADGETGEVLSKGNELEDWGIVVNSGEGLSRRLEEKFSKSWQTPQGQRIDRYLKGEDSL